LQSGGAVEVFVAERLVLDIGAVGVGHDVRNACLGRGLDDLAVVELIAYMVVLGYSSTTYSTRTLVWSSPHPHPIPPLIELAISIQPPYRFEA